jgi:membrane dipeptidase
MDDPAVRVTLSEREEARAKRLHAESVVFLAHDHLFEWSDIHAMQAGGVTAKIVKLTVDGLEWDEHGHRHAVPEFEGYLRRALEAVDTIYRMAEEHSGQVIIARTVAAIAQAGQRGQTALVLGLEGARPLEGSLRVLHMLHRMGIRDIQLAWAAPNQLIDEGRLSDFGKAVVGEMNDLGMLIDLSHLPERAWWEALELSAKPVIMSHTSCQALQGELSDEKIRALVDKESMIALHFVSHDYIYPNRGTEQAILDDLIDHIDHIRSLVGLDYVALGGDYFPHITDDRWLWVKEIETIDRMPNLTRGLVKRGYSDEEIAMVLGGNLLRCLERIWD